MAGTGVAEKVELEIDADNSKLKGKLTAGASVSQQSVSGRKDSAENQSGERERILPRSSAADIPDAVVSGESSHEDTGVVVAGDIHESGIVHGVVAPPGVGKKQGGGGGAELDGGDFRDSDIDVHHFEALDDGTIRVEDDEIEMADVPRSRSFGALTAPPPSDPAASISIPVSKAGGPGSAPASLETLPGGTRTIPPMRPSMRVGRVNTSSLPPPRKSRVSSLAPAGSLPPPRDETSAVWLEANHRMAMAREKSKNVSLERTIVEQRRLLLDVEGRLGRALGRVAELERAELEIGGVSEAEAVTANEVDSTPAVVAQVFVQGEMKASVEAVGSGRKSRSSDGAVMSDTRVRGAKSNLQQIEGIGPRVEASLNKQGITQLSQLAAWTDADVKRFAKRMKMSRSRIVKGRWVQRAKDALRVTADK